MVSKYKGDAIWVVWIKKSKRARRWNIASVHPTMELADRHGKRLEVSGVPVKVLGYGLEGPDDGHEYL